MQHSFVLLPEPHGRSLALLALRQTSLLGWSRAVLYKGVPYDLLREQQFTAGVHAVCIYAWVLPPAGMRAVCPWASRALVGQLMGKDGIVYRELVPHTLPNKVSKVKLVHLEAQGLQGVGLQPENLADRLL
eukprot:67559-Pelagomonas_calceolata.AAC.3